MSDEDKQRLEELQLLKNKETSVAIEVKLITDRKVAEWGGDERCFLVHARYKQCERDATSDASNPKRFQFRV